MNTTFNNNSAVAGLKAMTPAEAMIDASCSEQDAALDLAAFNAAHADRIRASAAAMRRYKLARRVNCWFDTAIVAMMITTAAACFGGLMTMLVR